MKIKLVTITCGFTLLSAAVSVKAQNTSINFEDHLIAHSALGFITSSTGGAAGFALLNGLANGDSGNWGMEGSNGPYLLGFWGSWNGNSQGYTGAGDTTFAAINFVLPNTTTPAAVNVSFDVLERTGSSGTYTFYGFNNGSLVSTITPTLTTVTIDGYTEQMATVNLTGVDEIRFNSTQPGGLDNFIFPAITAVPEPSTLALAGLGGLGALWQFRRRK